MLSRHVSGQLARYLDGDLPPGEAVAVAAHLDTCERCRRERDAYLLVANVMRSTATVGTPDTVWHAIEARLDARDTPGRAHPLWPYALAAALIVAVTAAVLSIQSHPGGDTWEIALQQPGGNRTVTRRPGEWIETAASSRARITVGAIGAVDVQPGTRLRLGPAAGAYRLALERGTIRAEISAPPRLFIVDTPANTVVDLGCAYTVTVGPDGSTELRMTSGWAALEWEGTETLVPAGAMSRTRKGARPGTPYFEDAPAPLREAVDARDAGDLSPATLQRILDSARVRDTLTLWHLLSRTDVTQRPLVYERLEDLVPAPGGTSRDRVLQLDPDTLRRWREELAWKW